MNLNPQPQTLDPERETLTAGVFYSVPDLDGVTPIGPLVTLLVAQAYTLTTHTLRD